MGQYSAVKRSELRIYTTTGKHSKAYGASKRSERSQSQSLQVDSIFMTFSQKPNHHNRRQKSIRLGQQESIGFKEPLGGDGSVLYLDCGGS